MDRLLKEEQQLFAHESDIYNQMRKIAGKLNTRIIEPIVRLKVIDGKSGRIKLFRERHSHSYVRNMFVSTTLAVPFTPVGSTYADGDMVWKDTDGSVSGATSNLQDIDPETVGSGYFGAASGDHHGVLVGRDATAEDFDDDFVLGNLVTDGTGPNQMEYLLTSKAEAWVGGSSYYSSTWTRGFDNVPAAPATITIFEVGLVYIPASALNIMHARDIDAGGVAVPNGDRLIVEYEIRTSFP